MSSLLQPTHLETHDEVLGGHEEHLELLGGRLGTLGEEGLQLGPELAEDLGGVVLRHGAGGVEGHERVLEEAPFQLRAVVQVVA